MKNKIKKLMFIIVLFLMCTGVVLAEPSQNVNCDDIADLINECGKIYNFIKIGLTVGLVILSMLEFGKAVMASDEEQLNKAKSHLITRIIIMVILFLLPVLIEWIIGIANIEGLDSSCIQEL